MDELPDDLVYPTPPLNKEQLLDIEELFKDLIHEGSAFESAPPSAQDLADRFQSQNTPSGMDSVGSAQINQEKRDDYRLRTPLK